MNQKQKEKWMASLQVGDEVCDCRFKHSKITVVEDVYWKSLPSKLLRILMAIPLIWRAEPLVTKLFGKTRLVERFVILEDGVRCSVMRCCDPVDHIQKHPT